MFSHLDLVEAALVRQVNTVAAGLGELSDRPVRQALAAFSFITIPSIRDCRARMLLYLETAQVSMMNGCLGQAEGCCRALNSLILEGEIPPQHYLNLKLPLRSPCWQRLLAQRVPPSLLLHHPGDP